MFRISKEFHFSASHRLDHLPADHQCARLHGHNYIVVVELAGATLNSDGFVRDYHALKPLKTYIDDHFDHRVDLWRAGCVVSAELSGSMTHI